MAVSITSEGRRLLAMHKSRAAWVSIAARPSKRRFQRSWRRGPERPLTSPVNLSLVRFLRGLHGLGWAGDAPRIEFLVRRRYSIKRGLVSLLINLRGGFPRGDQHIPRSRRLLPDPRPAARLPPHPSLRPARQRHARRQHRPGRRLLDASMASSRTADATTSSEPKPLSHPCPCCGGRMIIIETFKRGSSPRHRPATSPIVIRIDTS